MMNANEASALAEINKSKVIVDESEFIINKINKELTSSISIGKSSLNYRYDHVTHDEVYSVVEKYYKDLGYDVSYTLGTQYSTVMIIKW